MASKLLVIAGPNKGAAYFLQEGENILGRLESNSIPLVNSQVSKQHCVITLSGSKVELEDKGSSNGTFVNGVLAKKKLLKNQDKISIGPFVLQVITATLPAARERKSTQSLGAMNSTTTGAATTDASLDAFQAQQDEPKSMVAKLMRRFDDIVLPVVFDFHEKYDWLTLSAFFFLAFVLFNLGFSVYPILESSKKELLNEAVKRAEFIAVQMSDLNRIAVLEGKQALLNVDFALSDRSIEDAVIIDMEGRIMAPSSRLNQVYEQPDVWRIRDMMVKQQSSWTIKKRNLENNVVVVKPIMVLSKAKSMEVPGALAVVIFSKNGVVLDSGTIGVVYSETFITSMIIGIIFMYILYHMTMKPWLAINDNLDAVLKGNAEQVDKKYAGKNIANLVDTINAAIARIPKTDGSAVAVTTTDNEQLIVDNLMQVILNLAANMNHAAMVLDFEKRVKFMNPAFEEITGIHLSNAQGDVIMNVSRDEAFSSMILEMTEKSVKSGPDGIDEDFEFGSGLHKLNCKGITSLPGKVEAFLIVAEKPQE